MGKISPEIEETIKKFWKIKDHKEIEVIIQVKRRLQEDDRSTIQNNSVANIKKNVDESARDVIRLLDQNHYKHIKNPLSGAIRAYVPLQFIHKELRQHPDVYYVYMDSPVYQAIHSKTI